MLDPQRLHRLKPGARHWEGGQSALMLFDPHEGGFAFDGVTVGLVLSAQPDHWARYGDSRTRKLPLLVGDSWIFPKAMDGFCQWKERQAVLNLTLKDSVFTSLGLSVPGEEVHRVGRADPLTAELLLSLHDWDLAPRVLVDSLTAALAARLSNLTPATDLEPPRKHRQMARALDYIEQHLADDVPLASLAAAAAMSPFHFSRQFKQETGLPPHKYIQKRRMERAAELLRRPSATVMTVAFDVGYSDVSRFTELFKRHTGMTPGAYRAG